MLKRTITILMKKMLKNFLIIEMLLCMDLIFVQLYLSILLLKNKHISIQYMNNPMLIGHKNQVQRHNLTLIELVIQLDNLIQYLKKLSVIFQLWWEKIRKNKEIRRKKQAYKEVGSHQKIKD